jgi:hypothetical protein
MLAATLCGSCDDHFLIALPFMLLLTHGCGAPPQACQRRKRTAVAAWKKRSPWRTWAHQGMDHPLALQVSYRQADAAVHTCLCHCMHVVFAMLTT